MTDSKLPPLNQLKAFEAAARRGSFKEAAEELFVTAPAISHQIKSLEAFLDVALFVRYNRQIVLTDAGHRFFADVSKAFATIREATDAISNYKTVPSFVINTLPNIAALLLIPHIHEFQQHHQGFNIELVADTKRADFDNEKLNVAIRHKLGDEPDLVYIPLLKVSVSPFCSKWYLEENPQILSGDFSRIRLIRVTADPYNWDLWLSEWNINKPTNELRIGSLQASVDATINGGGIAMAYFPMFQHLLKTKPLVMPFPDKKSQYGEMYLVYKAENVGVPIYQAFEDWLKTIISREWSDK